MSQRLVHPDEALPGESIKVGTDYEGNEPVGHDDYRQFCYRWSSEHSRCAAVLNTFYDNVSGGYIANRRLVALIQTALSTIDVWLVHPDHVDGPLVPVEQFGGMQIDQEYYLLNSSLKQAGACMLWQFTVAGGGPFYSDDLVVDIFLDRHQRSQLIEQVPKTCEGQKVGYTYMGHLGQSCPPARRSMWQPWSKRS